MKIEVLKRIPSVTKSLNSNYTFNKSPLCPNSLAKLPLGSIRAKGWLGRQLELMTDGVTGRLNEISKYLRGDNGWFGEMQGGWEEQPYWFRGFHDLAVLTGNERCLAIADKWIDAVIKSQESDGYFGPKRKVGENGEKINDFWPQMIMLDAMKSRFECTGDEKISVFFHRFFSFCRDLSDDKFIPVREFIKTQAVGNIVWSSLRAGDMLPHLFWLYNLTGEKWLLDLARRFYSRIAPAEDEWLDYHVVNFTQRFSYPGLYYQLSKDRRHLELTDYWYTQHMGTWGQQPRGIFGADERIRQGKVDPRQGFETCGMVEFAKSFYLLGRITGDTVYADRTEDIFLNHFPAAQTPDLKGLHYLTASNMVQLDMDEAEIHDFRNKGFMLPFSPYKYRCCQHNIAMGWPYYVENLWQATADNGLAAWMYGASDVSAMVGSSGKKILISQDSDYPFRTDASMTIRCSEKVEFPLYLRIPRWCEGFSVSVNQEPLAFSAAPGSWIRLENEWKNGDRIEIKMPVRVTCTSWPRTGAVTVDRGPLSYSLKIREKWEKIEKSPSVRHASGDRESFSENWPEWEVFPESPWNYGLVIDKNAPDKSLSVEEKAIVAEQPWTSEDAPVIIKAKGKRLPGWRVENGMVQALPESPVESSEPAEDIEMVPLGCARLRMSCLPVVDNDGVK